ncbi:hypothetical protein BGY98DRAFT_1102807 [Russula aff. rugulosa BPL654]|nr:hypothetical protein BGY98DRAFT_1102807 [Russula aff. rugulosa BPL654]
MSQGFPSPLPNYCMLSNSSLAERTCRETGRDVDALSPNDMDALPNARPLPNDDEPTFTIRIPPRLTRFGGLLDSPETRFNIDLYTVVWRSQVIAHGPFQAHLVYLLRVDDINILLDSGSPDWCPRPTSSQNGGDNKFPWEQHCDNLKEIAPSVDLVLLSHGDPPHSGYFPDYTLTRTQVAVGIRDKEDVSSAEEQAVPSDDVQYVATPQEVHDSLDAANTLRYSKPAHLSAVRTIVYAVNTNHMRERHLDGTLLISDAGGTVFESFARPDPVGKTVMLPLSDWLGCTVSKEDVGEETFRKRSNKRRRDDDADEEAIGAFALRYKYLEFFLNPQVVPETCSSKDPKLIPAIPGLPLSHLY